MRALPYDVRDVRHIFVIRECPVVRRRVAPTKTGQNKACSNAVRALPYDVRDARHIFVIRECPVVRRRGDPMWSPESMFPQKLRLCGIKEATVDTLEHQRQ